MVTYVFYLVYTHYAFRFLKRTFPGWQMRAEVAGGLVGLFVLVGVANLHHPFFEWPWVF